jgi:hypothetical protein
VNHNQEILGVGYNDKLLLFGPQAQQFHFILKEQVSSKL